MTLVYTGFTKAQQVEVQRFGRHQPGPLHVPSAAKDKRRPEDLQDLFHCSGQDQSHEALVQNYHYLLYIDSNISPIPPTGLSFTSGQVRRELERLNQRKAAGPDGISPRVLKSCSRQLCGILQHLFNQSFHLQRIPALWKTSCLVPVPKKTHPVAPSDYRPIAVTSHIMKVMERLVLTHLRPLVSPFQDPLQFAYQPKVGVDDAVIYLLQRAYSSLDRVRVMFFDFSSAFNTIQPRLLRAMLEKMQMDAPLVSWIEDYLTGRPQFVRLRSCVSDSNKLEWSTNTDAVYKKAMSRLYFLRRLRSFSVCSRMLHMFYQSVMASTISFAVVCWGAG
ncbi:hypothetical protein D4764_10G0002830 [Takifugu flavidus]|uniref:Reverse transcriptase domain-containing protein n=1 Tax=Takifugu flavidus TaxID=433684 RepID=A0A5C6PID7_9TELE|nr:hypothetical protein D4764_10G0002830 [Takifugu flavidus]